MSSSAAAASKPRTETSSRSRPESREKKRRPESGDKGKSSSSKSKSKPSSSGGQSNAFLGDRGEARKRRKDHQRKILDELQKQRPAKDKGSKFLCELKHWSALPDVPLNAKFVKMMLDPRRFSAYRPTSIENNYKPIMHTEPDLGVPIDMIDPSKYLAPKDPPPLAEEDQRLIDGFKKKVHAKGGLEQNSHVRDIRGTKKTKGKGVKAPWLRETMYIANDLYDDINVYSRQTQIVAKTNEHVQAEAEKLRTFTQENYLDIVDKSFKVANSGDVPVHPTKKNMKPLMVCPLFPDFERWKTADGFCRVSFEDAMTLRNDLKEKKVDDGYEYGKPRKIRRLDGSMIRNVRKREVENNNMGVTREGTTGSLLIRRKKCPDTQAINETSGDLKWLREYHIPELKQLAPPAYVFMLDEEKKVCTYVTVDSGLTLRRLKKASRRDYAADVKVKRNPIGDLKVEESKEARLAFFEPGADDEDEDMHDEEDAVADVEAEAEKEADVVKAVANDDSSDDSSSDDEKQEKEKKGAYTSAKGNAAKDEDKNGDSSDSDDSSSSSGSDSSSSDDDDDAKKKKEKVE